MPLLTGSSSGTLTTRTGVWRNLWIPAKAINARTSNYPAEAEERQYNTYITLDSLKFDGATAEHGMIPVVLPDEWDSSEDIRIKVYWDADTGASTGDTVAWDARLYTFSDGDDVSFSNYCTFGRVTDTVIDVGKFHISEPSAAPVAWTFAAPSDGDILLLDISRNPGVDDMTEDAILFGVLIQYKESETEPSEWEEPEGS